MTPLGSSLVLLLLLQGIASSPPPQPPDKVIEAVSKNVKEYQDLLPDFVCNEKITSAAYESGNIQKLRTVDSVFTARQKPSLGPGSMRAAFTESREVSAIDGKPVPRGTRMPGLPIQFTGGFSSVLNMTFSPENLQFHHYDLNDKPEEAGNLLIRFATNENQSRLLSFFDGESLLNKDTGKAWIDITSMQVVRLERNFLNLPHGLMRLINTVDYLPVNIGGRPFWLPRLIRTDSTERDIRKTGTYIASYSNCKRFVADIKFLP